MKTAIVLGATGLIGKNIVKLLIQDPAYTKIKLFVRRSTGISDSRLEEHIVDFNKIENWKAQVHGDELFSALGTTIKKAGSKEAQYKIDFTYQYEVAKTASENGVAKYLLVSSLGANKDSSNFYLKIKGELDQKVRELSFKNIFIFRPSLLVGNREENRSGESIGAIFGKVIAIIPGLRKYRPIPGELVAKAMLNTAKIKSDSACKIFTADEIFKLV